MRVAVVGATGRVGRHVVAALRDTGHEAVPVARAVGVDVLTGAGLDDALAGVEAVVDVLNSIETDRAAVEEFFGTTTEHLLAAEGRAGVAHHVLLSIVGIERVEGNAHYAGKRRQEHLVEAGSVPWTILRATQFFDFAVMVAGWTARDGVATVPPLLVQPVAVTDVADVLVELATGPPQGRAADLAGPETQDLVDMARRTLAVRDDPTRIQASWRGTPFGTGMAGEVLLPDATARLGATTFDAWLGRGAPG
jgi:uncharacterized protein YbjT (DUF2867 family)